MPGRYPVFLNYEYLVFFNENQGVCQAGIALKDLGKEDPPVYTGYDNTVWIRTTETLSGFLTAMCGYQGSICLEYSPERFYWISDEEVRVIEKNFSKRQEALQNWLNFRVDLYGNDINGRIALMYTEGDIQMIYAANNKKTFEEMKTVLYSIGEVI